MDLASILTPSRIRIPLAATDKTAAITELIDLLAATGALANRDQVLDAVLKRESERTTGIGYGVAIPHGKTPGCRQLVIAAGKPSEPIDFQSIDGRPVTFVLLLVTPPDQTSLHIQALAKVSRLLQLEDFRAAVEHARSGEELHAAIVTAEAG
jgi:fructose-specific phosphotransferase system IIA component